MRRSLSLAFVVLTLLAACQLGTPRSPGGAPATEQAPAEITVTALGAPAAGAVDAAPDILVAPAVLAATGSGPAMTEDQLATQTPVNPASGDAVAAAAAAVTPEPVVPEQLKSPSQIACEKKKGKFARVGRSGTFACVLQTRDGGKRCSKESDCEGLCLARSRTCSPITPVFGCQDILQQDGLRVTQCVE